MCSLCDIEVENDRPSCPTCGETELTAMGNCPNGCDDDDNERGERFEDKLAMFRAEY